MNIFELLHGARYGKYDKSVHFLLSVAITALLLAAGIFPLPVVVILALAVGVGKEVWDWRWRKSRFDFVDLLVDAAGVGAMVIVYLLVW